MEYTRTFSTVASLWRVGVGFLLAVFFFYPCWCTDGQFCIYLRFHQEPLFWADAICLLPRLFPLLDFGVPGIERGQNLLIFIGVFFLQLFDGYGYSEMKSKDLIPYLLGGNRTQTLLQVIFPHRLTWILDAVDQLSSRMAASNCFRTDCSNRRFFQGRRISVAGRFLRTDEMGLIATGLINIWLGFSIVLRASCSLKSQKR